ncbi:hypothetical protein S1OALGB6SA_2301 [Olavius algarvensis spirochete endosymbiont]|nr:hypothetical protein S1OALGB6SA_2301 [Olavius algarvensis spirochete endosymbiont]
MEFSRHPDCPDEVVPRSWQSLSLKMNTLVFQYTPCFLEVYPGWSLPHLLTSFDFVWETRANQKGSNFPVLLESPVFISKNILTLG